MRPEAPNSAGPDASVETQAAMWLLRLHDAPEQPEVQADFDAWLAEHPRHEEAWATAKQVWALAEDVGPAPSTAETLPFPSPRPQRSRQRWMARLAVAASLALAVVFGPDVLVRVQADHITGVGHIIQIDLDDGSTLALDTDSAVSVDYNEDSRVVRLLSGQAFFSVESDPERPFEVMVGDARIRVTGTAFEVQQLEGATSVAVAEGEVQVSVPGQDTVVMEQGEVVHAGSQMMRHGTIRPRSIAPWREGRLLIEGSTVSGLVDALSRYHPGFILLADDTLGDKPVTGVFQLADPVHALQAVVEPHAGMVQQISPWLVIISQR